MYRGFNVSGVKFNDDKGYSINSKIQTIENELREKGNYIIERLADYIVPEGIVNATDMQSDWFPNKSVKADIFISHSHNDIRQVALFVDYLKCVYNLTSFVDYYVWGDSTKLLSKILELYNPKNNQKTAWLASHVHMMLSMALTKMIDKCECLLFFNTPNSLTFDNLNFQTSSPWIYHEIGISSVIQKKDRKEHRGLTKIGAILEKVENFSFQYNLDLSHLNTINTQSLNNWKELSDNKKAKGVDALDILYDEISKPRDL